MPAYDTFHDVVKNGLIKDGWTITRDPYPLEYGGKDLYIDLGAEKMIAAERGNQLIAVEIRSFLGPSVITEYHIALGQFLNYRMACKPRIPRESCSSPCRGTLTMSSSPCPSRWSRFNATAFISSSTTPGRRR